jgi:GNAT superfamily N-acetyltransferase
MSYENSEKRQIPFLADESKAAFIAEIDSEIVGFAMCGARREGPVDFTGELFGIYVLDSHQGYGIGRKLTNAAVSWLSEHGHTSMLVWVLKANKSVHFYERLGGVLVAQKDITLGSAWLAEVAYGWTSLDHLMR